MGRNLSCYRFSGLLCPFERAQLGGACVGTTEVSWSRRSRWASERWKDHLWGWKAPSASSPGAGDPSPPLHPTPFSAPFSCLFLQICFRCLLRAFLLPQNLPWIWSWLWPNSSLRVLSFPSSTQRFHSRENLPGSYRVTCPSWSNQLWSEVPVEPFGIGTQVCVPASPLPPSSLCRDAGAGGAWCAGVLGSGRQGRSGGSPAVLMASGGQGRVSLAWRTGSSNKSRHRH